MRNISFHLTTPQFVAGTKDVTRRGGWVSLPPGEVLCAVEKGQGIPKGESIKRLGHIITVDCRRERLDRMTTEPEYGRDECRREGFPEMTPEQFVDFFCGSHDRIEPESDVTRIEFKKVPVIREVFGLHVRMSYGSTMGYDLHAEDGAKVGAKSVFTPRGKYREKNPAKTVYTLLETKAEFETAAAFITAYMETLR